MTGQSQRAGQGSQLIQVAGNIVIGVTEERAHEIALEQAQHVVAEYAAEAHETIQARISELDNRVVEALGSADDLNSFADPAFQRAYRKAQQGAAASERASDYDMLAAMLAERAERPQERSITAGIDRAIEIIDQVDDEALRAVTVMSALLSLSPNAGRAGEGLDAMESIFASLVDGPLPTGSDWMDHLDILNAIRVDTVSGVRPFRDFYSSRMSGYVSPGVLIKDIPPTLEGDFTLIPWLPLLVDHEYKPGYKRLPFPNETTLRHVWGMTNMDQRLIDAIVEQGTSNLAFGQVDTGVVDAFMNDVKSRPTLAIVSDWWDTVEHGLQITSVGRTLGRANAYRLDASGQYPRD